METILLIIILVLVVAAIILLAVTGNTGNRELQTLAESIRECKGHHANIESSLKDDFRINRQESAAMAKTNRDELHSAISTFRSEITLAIDNLNKQNVSTLDKLNLTLEQKVTLLNEQAKADQKLIREALEKSVKAFRETFDQNVRSFNDLQREKFGQLEKRQDDLVRGTETKLESIRVTVEEKLEKTLSDRLGQSFETVGRQLLEVQKGLGEMQTLAQDVGGLKQVLSNVKMRGGFGEVQLSMLLEQILAPGQYEANVRTKPGSNDVVEFAIKLPGRDDNNTQVWLPVDAKFPKDAYQQLQDAY